MELVSSYIIPLYIAYVFPIYIVFVISIKNLSFYQSQGEKHSLQEKTGKNKRRDGLPSQEMPQEREDVRESLKQELDERKRSIVI